MKSMKQMVLVAFVALFSSLVVAGDSGVPITNPKESIADIPCDQTEEKASKAKETDEKTRKDGRTQKDDCKYCEPCRKPPDWRCAHCCP